MFKIPEKTQVLTCEDGSTVIADNAKTHEAKFNAAIAKDEKRLQDNRNLANAKRKRDHTTPTLSNDALVLANYWHVLIDGDNLITRSTLDSLRVRITRKCSHELSAMVLTTRYLTCSAPEKARAIQRLRTKDCTNRKGENKGFELLGKRSPLRKLWRALDSASVCKDTGTIGFKFKDASGNLRAIDGIAESVKPLALRLFRDIDGLRAWKYKQRGFTESTIASHRREIPMHDVNAPKHELANRVRSGKNNQTKAQNTVVFEINSNMVTTAQELDDAAKTSDTKYAHREVDEYTVGPLPSEESFMGFPVTYVTKATPALSEPHKATRFIPHGKPKHPMPRKKGKLTLGG